MQSRFLTDHALSCRLERAEGLACARFVEARARLAPDSGAQWTEIAGTYAMYDGPRSPITQTFGLGMFQMPTTNDMDALEAFFQDRGASVFHEVSPIADKSILEILNQRGYRPVELSSVMFLPLVSPAPAEMDGNNAVRIRQVNEGEQELWARTAAEGWRDLHEGGDQLVDLFRISCARNSYVSFLAELDGRAIATASLIIANAVGLLAGSSTIPEWRRRGAQRALLECRLQYAAQAGCDLAMICAEPGSSSQRNAERAGFQIAYTRIKWGLL
jgi:GNAT superfamily N-acetyltransferase